MVSICGGAWSWTMTSALFFWSRNLHLLYQAHRSKGRSLSYMYIMKNNPSDLCIPLEGMWFSFITKVVLPKVTGPLSPLAFVIYAIITVNILTQIHNTFHELCVHVETILNMDVKVKIGCRHIIKQMIMNDFPLFQDYAKKSISSTW